MHTRLLCAFITNEWNREIVLVVRHKSERALHRQVERWGEPAAPRSGGRPRYLLVAVAASRHHDRRPTYKARRPSTPPDTVVDRLASEEKRDRCFRRRRTCVRTWPRTHRRSHRDDQRRPITASESPGPAQRWSQERKCTKVAEKCTSHFIDLEFQCRVRKSNCCVCVCMYVSRLYGWRSIKIF